jgi:integrase
MEIATRYYQDNDSLDMERVNSFIIGATKGKRNYFITKSAFRHLFTSEGRGEEFKTLIKIRQKDTVQKGIYLTKDDLRQIIESMPTIRYQTVAIIQYCTGARASDVLGIRNEDVKKEGDSLRIKLVQKGGGERIVFIPSIYAKRIYNYVKITDQEYPFLRMPSEYSNIDTVIDNNYHIYYLELRGVVERLGFRKFRTHDFRRNFIDDAFDQTTDIRIVSKAVGHKRISTTLRYLDQKETPEKTKEIIRKVRGE